MYVKRAGAARLRASLVRARESGREIAIGTATDPYQPAEGRFAVTRRCLGAMAQVPALRIGITTKSTGSLRDREVLAAIARDSDLWVTVSLISLDADLLRQIEPRAPRPDLRLDAMRALAADGIHTRLFLMPVLPLLTDGEARLRELRAAAPPAGRAPGGEHPGPFPPTRDARALLPRLRARGVPVGRATVPRALSAPGERARGLPRGDRAASRPTERRGWLPVAHARGAGPRGGTGPPAPARAVVVRRSPAQPSSRRRSSGPLSAGRGPSP